MELTWIDVADTAIKIGLGSLITAVSGYLVLIKNRSFEEDKELRNSFYRLQEEKKSKYVEFLSQSQSLVQSYLMSKCNCDTEEYKRYLRAFNEAQIISSDEIRMAAYKLHAAVDQFIVINKNGLEAELSRKIRKAVNDSVGYFQKISQDEVTRSYKKT